MTEKIKVSPDVAKSIEHAKKFLTINEVLENHCDIKSDSFGIKRWIKESHFLNELTTEELATALLVGYEVELTAHEIVAKDYNGALKSRNETTSSYKERFFDGYLLGVESTLETLGIEIKGIN